MLRAGRVSVAGTVATGTNQRKHHSVAVYSLRRFTDEDGLLWPYDTRACKILRGAERPGPKGAGWIANLNSTKTAAGWNADVEDWLAREIDDPGAKLLDRLLSAGLVDHADRDKYSEVINAQMLRTPQGYRFLGETSPDALTRDELRERLRDALQQDGGWLLSEQAWTLLHPPTQRSFVVSDNPVSSRALHWPEGAASTVPIVSTRERGIVPAPQVTWPLTPTACLEVKMGPRKWLGHRDISVGELLEINLRTAMAADRWVWANSEDSVVALARDVAESSLVPFSTQLGTWPR